VVYFVRYHVITSRAITARATPPTTDVSNCVPVSPVHSNSASNMRPILGVGQANYKAGRGGAVGGRVRVKLFSHAFLVHSQLHTLRMVPSSRVTEESRPVSCITAPNILGKPI
jgi:hypothetical protein